MIQQPMDTFQLNLFKLINKTRAHDNLLFSPISLYIALALCANGAERNTLTEMLHALSKDCTLDQLNNDCTRIIAKLSSTQSVKVANAVMSTIQKTPEFTAKCKEYKAFDEPLKSVAQVNDWCAKNTNNKITSIIDTIDEYTRLLILNAVYFLGKWKQSFNKAVTVERTFTNSNQEKSQCQMMEGVFKAPYGYFNDCEAMQLDYSEKKVSALIILPLLPINDFIAQLTHEKLLNYIANLSKTSVVLSLPRFMIESTELLNGYLIDLGIKQAFNQEQGEFQKMFKPKGQYYISNVTQKSFIKVDEDGTEAASVTKVEVTESCSGLSSGPKRMYCSNPFLFIIRHHDIKDHFLFITKIDKPS